MSVREFVEQDEQMKKPSRISEEQLRNEYNYLLAEQITKKLLKNGLISEEEFEKIMRKNQDSFSPFLSRIYRKRT